MKGKQRKKSRFLRHNQDEDDHQEEDRHAGELANSILGLRNDSMGDYDKYRPELSRYPEPTRFSRRTDLDDEPAPASRKTFVDDDDTDFMIKNLKEKTSRRHMSDILGDLDFRDITPPKFEPIAKFKDTFKPSPSPERKYGSLNRRSSFDQRTSLADYRDPNPDSGMNYAPFGASRQTNGADYLGMDGLGGGRGGGGVVGGGRGGGGIGNYGSLGRPRTNYNQQYAQASFGQSQPSYSGQSYSQPSYSAQSQPTYPTQRQPYGYGQQQQQQQQQPGYTQQQLYGASAYGNDMYGMGGYGAQSYGPPQQRPIADYGQGGYGMGGYGQQPPSNYDQGYGQVGGYGQQQGTQRRQMYGGGGAGY